MTTESSLFHRLLALKSRDTWKSIGSCDVLLVRHDVDCGYTHEGQAYSQLMDSMGELCLQRGLVVRSIALPYSRLLGSLAHNAPLSFNRAALAGAILRRGVRLLKGQAYALDWTRQRRAKLWGRILDKAKPCYVIAIEPDEGLCRSARERGVHICDLQHGLIVDDMPQYGEKYRSDTPLIDLPDHFLCWDDPSAATLRKWATQRGIDVRIIGNPWFSRFLFSQAGDSLVHDVDRSDPIFDNGRPTILVSMDWGMAEPHSHRGMSGVIVEALETAILETAGSHNWLLRLHPVQTRGGERRIVREHLERTFAHSESVDWRSCTDLPLPVVLQQADLHITSASATYIEASWLGIRSALLGTHVGPGGRLESVGNQIRGLELVDVLPQDAVAIKEWITDALAKGRGESTFLNARDEQRAFVDEIERAATSRDAG